MLRGIRRLRLAQTVGGIVGQFGIEDFTKPLPSLLSDGEFAC